MDPEPLPPRLSRLMALLGLALLPRLALFPWNENLHGDAVVRTELARAWLEHPHWISSLADGSQQFGPLHIYLVAAALWLWPAAEHAGRLVSLGCGVASVVPLFFFTRRLFGERSAVWACAGLAIWGLHIQMSTTAGSEALSLLLFLSTLALYARARETGRMGPLLAAAVFMNLTCATRYDAWLLAGLLAVGLVLDRSDLQTAARQSLLFGLACLPFPVVWMVGNAHALGDPLAPMHYIDAFHHQWAATETGQWGVWRTRLQGLFFWPAAALTMLSPPLGALGVIGLVRDRRAHPERRWVRWLILVPTAYFATRGAMLTFVPLARFTVNQLVLLLPWSAGGFDALVARASVDVRHRVRAAIAVLALAAPITLGVASALEQGRLIEALSPVSPVSRNPPEIRAMARVLAERLREERGQVLLDADEGYSDVQIAFYSGLPEERWIRRRWPDQLARRLRSQPALVLLLPGGVLRREANVHVGESELVLDGGHYRQEPGVPSPYSLWRRAVP